MIYLILIFLAGASAALSDRSKFHPLTLPDFLQNRNWWNTGLIRSWKLKYKNNDPSKGPKLWLSTSVFVIFTDSHHFFKALSITLIFIGMNGAIFYLPLTWIVWHWLIGLVIYKLGFAVIYK